ncbi:MAG: hypothetical protein WD045_14530, partial [Pirellulaceae bacterium]
MTATPDEAYVTDDSQNRNSTPTDPPAHGSGGGEGGGADKPKKAPISFGSPPVAPVNSTAWNVLPSVTTEPEKPAASEAPQVNYPAGKAPLSFGPPPTPHPAKPADKAKGTTPQTPVGPSPTQQSPPESSPLEKPGPKPPPASQPAQEKSPTQKSRRPKPEANVKPTTRIAGATRTKSPPSSDGVSREKTASQPKTPREESNKQPATPSAESRQKSPQRRSPQPAATEDASATTQPPRVKRSPPREQAASAPETPSAEKQVPAKQGGKADFASLIVPKRKPPEIVGPQVQPKEASDDPTEEVKEAAVRFAPPWLVSMLIHFALVILLVLLTWNSNAPEERVITATYAEQLGEQLEQEIMILDTEEFLPDDLTSAASVDLPVQDDMPLPATLTELSLDGTKTAREAEEENFGAELSARGDARTRRTLVQAYGGNATTEQAVAEALEWLKRNQRRDGSWSMTGPYSNAGSIENPVAATAMALLAFQGAGHTDREGTHAAVVAKGWKFLLGELDGDGNFIQDGLPNQQRLYSQAQATIALCELYAMTRDEELEPRA